jgi:hypothetical protein
MCLSNLSSSRTAELCRESMMLTKDILHALTPDTACDRINLTYLCNSRWILRQEPCPRLCLYTHTACHNSGPVAGLNHQVFFTTQLLKTLHSSFTQYLWGPVSTPKNYITGNISANCRQLQATVNVQELNKKSCNNCVPPQHCLWLANATTPCDGFVTQRCIFYLLTTPYMQNVPSKRLGFLYSPQLFQNSFTFMFIQLQVNAMHVCMELCPFISRSGSVHIV